jgi:hypothetical protein
MIKEIKLLPRIKPGARGLPPRQLILECDHCHATFERLYTNERFKQVKHFCSMNCVYAGRDPSPLHGRKTTRQCSHCDESITRMTSFMEGKEHVFCDRECLRAWKVINTPPERAQVMMTDKAQAKAKASMAKIRSASDYVHPWTDRQHTEESKAKMRASGAGKHVGERNGMYDREHTEESRAKMSDSHSRNIVEGKAYLYGGSKHKSGWYTSPKGNDGQPMFYHSSWEEALMFHLDADENVMKYDFERLRIAYQYQGKKRHYVPDFLITYTDGSRVLCELKPKQFLDNEKTRLKAEAARAHCFANDIQTYEILTGEILRERGIIA